MYIAYMSFGKYFNKKIYPDLTYETSKISQILKIEIFAVSVQ